MANLRRKELKTARKTNKHPNGNRVAPGEHLLQPVVRGIAGVATTRSRPRRGSGSLSRHLKGVLPVGIQSGAATCAHPGGAPRPRRRRPVRQLAGTAYVRFLSRLTKFFLAEIIWGAYDTIAPRPLTQCDYRGP